MRRAKADRRATALVITVGLLAVLAVIGFGFAVLMRLNVDSARAYATASQLRLLSHAAVQYAVGDIRGGWSNAEADASGTIHSVPTGALHDPTDDPTDPWYFDPTMAKDGYEDANGKQRYCSLRCNSYVRIHDCLGDRLAVSLVRVLDSAGKINVNDDNDRLNNILSTLFDQLGLGSSTIVSNRPPGGYRTLEEVKQRCTIDDRTFEILKHHITIYSWPHQLPSVDPFDPYTLTAADSGDPSPTLTVNDGDLRSPVNINTASREVLFALLRNIKDDNGSDVLDDMEAGHVADLIRIRRDPDNPDFDGLLAGFRSTWSNWASGSGYRNARNRQVHNWRSWRVGPFDNTNELIEFLYDLDDGSAAPAAGDAGRDPFGDAAGSVIDQAEADWLAANFAPSSFASIVANPWPRMTYTSCDGDHDPLGHSPRVADSTQPSPNLRGKNDLVSSGTTTTHTTEFCFSSMGRFEILTRTYAFVKAFSGKVTSDAGPTTNPCTLTDNDKARPWRTYPAPEWRGYSVLIYDGKGKGQLRAIVHNTSESLIVARWSADIDGTSTGSNRSRYYILGPGPLVDRTCNLSFAHDYEIDINDPDDDTAWEDDQWNGHRLVVYKWSLVGGKIQIDQDSVQERIIVDTDGSSKKLTVVPDLDTSLLAGSGHGYMILGTYGATTRDAAVKAYDVLRHTSQRDFAPGGSSDEPNDICIGPEKVPASWSGNQGRHDGYIAVRELEVDAGDSATLGGTATFRQNFTEADIAADTGEAKHSTTTAATGSFFAGGDVVAEGLYLRKSGDKAGYDVTNLVTADNDDGGVVGFWFCPDKSLFSGSHTLVRIHGATTSELLDLVVENGRIRVRIEANRAQVYDTLDTGEGVRQRTVNYQQGTWSYEDPTYNDISSSGMDWKPGEWHHIAFAWFECVDDAGSDNNPTYDDDSNAETDWRDDEVAPPGTDRLLDPAPQVYAVVRVWIDGQSGFDSTASAINAFNLTPAGAGKPALQLGIASSPACGVFDSVAARPLAETEKSLTGINGISVDPRNRYMGNDSGSATYYSFERTIDLPHPIARVGAVCLGTIALDACYPRKYIDKDDAYPPVKATVELLDKDDATVGGTAQTAPFDEPTGARCTLGQGYVLRDSSWDTIHDTDAAKIRYTLKLTAYQGETAAGQFPQRCWESPVVNAVTITYLGPVVFYRWR